MLQRWTGENLHRFTVWDKFRHPNIEKILLKKMSFFTRISVKIYF